MSTLARLNTYLYALTQPAIRTSIVLLLIPFCALVHVSRSDTHENFEPLHRWYAANHIEHPGLEVGIVPGFGRGILATRDIEKGEMVMKVPANAFFSVEHARVEFPVLPPNTGRTDALAIVLLYEKHARGEQSRWKEFIEYLPDRFDTTLFWNDHELDELQRSALRGYTEARRRRTEAQYTKYFEQHLFIEFKETFSADKFTLEEFKWALSNLWSRSFLVNVDGEMSSSMVPFADMFNAAPGKHQSDVTIQQVNDAIIYHAAHDIRRGDQVLAFYGAGAKGLKPNVHASNEEASYRHASRSGFAVIDNPMDGVPMPTYLLLPRTTAHFDEKYDALNRASLAEQIVVHHPRAQPPVQLMQVARLVAMNADEWAANDGAGDVLGDRDVTVSQRNELEALRHVGTLMRRMLDAYGDTTLLEDQALLDHTKEEPGAIPYRRRLALVLRTAEKSILAALASLSDQRRDELLGVDKRQLRAEMHDDDDGDGDETTRRKRAKKARRAHKRKRNRPKLP